MDVTNENFRGAFHLLQHVLPGASFVSIDFEFAGLGFTRPSNLDTPQHRYSIAREDARNFPPLQFGISIFHRLTTSTPNGLNLEQPLNSTDWHTTTFNFNLHPRAVFFPPNQRYPLIDKDFRLQASTVDFLTQHGFQFGKNFASGISWLRKPEETFLRKTVTEIYGARQNPKNPVSPNDISKDDAAYLAMYKHNLDQWIENNNHPEAQTSNPPAKIVMFECPRPPFQRRLVFDLIRQQYPRIACSLYHMHEGVRIRIALHASVQLAELNRKRDLHMEIEQVVSKEVAARLVFDLIHQHKVTLVVHHGLVDLTKWVGNFVRDLPPALSDFKLILKDLFARVYDTKWAFEQLCKFDPGVAKRFQQEYPMNRFELSQYVAPLRKLAFERKLTSVMDIKTFIPKRKWYDTPVDERVPLPRRIEHTILSEFDDEFVEEGEDTLGFSRYACEEANDFKHEAGYDALETGTLFALIFAFAGEKEMNKYANNIYMGACGGFKCLDLDSDDVKNEWFQQFAIIVTGEWKGQQRRDVRYHQIISRLLIDSPYDADLTQFAVVNRLQFIAILKLRETSDEESVDMGKELEKLSSNGAEVGLNVVRYQMSALIESRLEKINLTDESSDPNKRRKME